MKIKSFSIVLLAFAATASQANLIVNGSFEDPALAPNTYGFYNSITGWTKVGDPQIEVGRSEVYGLTGATGLNVLELDSTANSTVQQTLGLSAGLVNLKFDFAKRADTEVATNAFLVKWNGALVASISPTSTTFSTASYNLAAVAGTNTLQFIGNGMSDSFGGMIDNVRMEAVPEPTSIAAVGMGALALLRRRRKA